MKALIINLKNSTDRMSFMDQQLKALSINYNRLEAVDASKLSNEIYSKYSDNWERPLRRSEIACFMSHKRAWELVIKENQPFLILEDDVILNRQTKDILDLLQNLESHKFINLETSYRAKFLSKNCLFIDNKFALHELYHNKTGAAAYIIWPSVAKFLLSEFYNKGAALADAAIYNNFFKLKQYQIKPALAIQAHDCKRFEIKEPFIHSSTISNESKPKSRKSFFNIWKRLNTQLTIFLVYLTKFTKGVRCKITFSDGYTL